MAQDGGLPEVDPDAIPLEVVWAAEMAMHDHLGHTEPWEICPEAACDGDTAGIAIEAGIRQWLGTESHTGQLTAASELLDAVTDATWSEN